MFEGYWIWVKDIIPIAAIAFIAHIFILLYLLGKKYPDFFHKSYNEQMNREGEQ